MGRKKNPPRAVAQQPPSWLALATLPLLVLGLAASAYLLVLYVEVMTSGGQEVESFCAVTQEFNCVTVANSRYASFAGLPVALYGLEYFALATLMLLLSWTQRWQLRRWDSLLFVGAVLSLPASAVLAWISAYRIQSLCLLCLTIYGINLALFALLAVSRRDRLSQLLCGGPRELLGLLSRPAWAAGMIVLTLVLLSQFLWVPRLLASGRAPDREGIWKGLPVAGQTLGPADAPYVIEEFTDFQCPVCGQAHKVMAQVMGELPGKVRLVHRDFPLDMACNPIITRPFHTDACLAAYYARCAAEQGKYWPYEELLFQNRHQLDEQSLKDYGRQLALDVEELTRCAASPETKHAVQQDIQHGIQRGLRGTPTFFINGEKVVGVRPLGFWREQLRGNKAEAPPAPAEPGPADPR